MQVTSGGQDFEIRNITLNSSTDTPVDFNQHLNSAILKCRTSVDVYIRRTSGDSNYFTIPAGGSLSLDVAFTDTAQGGYILCWARSASTTPVLEVIGSF